MGGVHFDAPGQRAAQRLPRVGMADGLEDPPVAGAGQQVVGEGVEEPAARAEDEVDRRAGHACALRHLVDADRLSGRLAQALVERVEDALAVLLGGLRPEALRVRAASPSASAH